MATGWAGTMVADSEAARRLTNWSAGRARPAWVGVLAQAAVILASLLLSAANSDKPIPAAPLPTSPTDDDPFRYHDPAKD